MRLNSCQFDPGLGYRRKVLEINFKTFYFGNMDTQTQRNVKTFLQAWMLPIAMATGVLAYFAVARLHLPENARGSINRAIGIIQPSLIFCMLFLSFCKINPKRLRLRPWHGWLLLIQCVSFLLLSLPPILYKDLPSKVLWESAMICMLCPTATAAAVITGKLGGNTTNLVTYTILINLATAVAVPAVFPLVNPSIGMGFFPSFLLILGKVFPLLIIPLLLAFLVRYLLPDLHKTIVKAKDLAFYIWSVSLTLALAVTTKIIVHSEINWYYELGIILISLVCCILQFVLGKRIGGRHHDRISGGQSMGQKNTVFAIWLGYTFLSPITSLAGGFYTIWHNLFNAYQLYRIRQEQEKQKKE